MSELSIIQKEDDVSIFVNKTDQWETIIDLCPFCGERHILNKNKHSGNILAYCSRDIIRFDNTISAKDEWKKAGYIFDKCPICRKKHAMIKVGDNAVFSTCSGRKFEVTK